ncbi:hypothetical protein AMECASPLE_016181 [Ameca splendens]|uniref:Uncharacterized protein n=1 Tax=Ameca splendens TaxID=208324 RepID=A0ABV1A9B2_9TELE
MTHKYPLSAAPTVLKRAQLRVSSFYVNISGSERDPRRRERSLNDEEEGGVAFTDVRPSAARYTEVCGSLSLSVPAFLSARRREPTGHLWMQSCHEPRAVPREHHLNNTGCYNPRRRQKDIKE